MPRLTSQPSSNSIASRSHICWRVRPLASLIAPRSRPLCRWRAHRPPALGRRRHLDQAVHVDARRCTSSGSIAPGGRISSSTSTIVTFAAIAISGLKLRCDAAEAEVAERVGLVGADKGVIERQRLFEQVFAAVEDARLAALGELGADRGRGVEGRDAGAGGAHALGQRALRHQLGLDPALLVILAEDQPLRGAGRRGERADHLRSPGRC